MTDYNDGKWHGWNGGECPVHPESEVETSWRIYRGGFRDGHDYSKACNIAWEGNEHGSIIAFRVTKPYVEPKKPREVWADDGGCFWDSYSEAKHYSPDGEPVLFREVLDD